MRSAVDEIRETLHYEGFLVSRGVRPGLIARFLDDRCSGIAPGLRHAF
jgi:hypothetical protein